MQSEIGVKTDRLAEMLAAENFSGVILNSQANFAWLTGGANNAIDTSRENGACSLLICRGGKRYVLASKIEMPRVLAEEISESDFEPIEYSWESEKASSNYLPELAGSLLNADGNLTSDLPFAASIQTIENLIAPCRASLTRQEIERYRMLGRDAGAIVGNLAKKLAPGQSEVEIARTITAALAETNIRSVVTLVAADERLVQFRHPIPTEKKWKNVVMLVVCAKRAGLIVSLSRIISAGKISDELRQKMDSCARINTKLWAATKSGTSGADFYRIAADAYAAENRTGEINLHHQGGATGYKTRDWVAHPNSSETVQFSQAFAWNPTISGAKTEETIIYFEHEIEMITASPDWASIAVETNGREYHLPDVLSL